MQVVVCCVIMLLNTCETFWICNKCYCDLCCKIHFLLQCTVSSIIFYAENTFPLCWCPSLNCDMSISKLYYSGRKV